MHWSDCNRHLLLSFQAAVAWEDLSLDHGSRLNNVRLGSLKSPHRRAPTGIIRTGMKYQWGNGCSGGVFIENIHNGSVDFGFADAGFGSIDHGLTGHFPDFAGMAQQGYFFVALDPHQLNQSAGDIHEIGLGQMLDDVRPDAIGNITFDTHQADVLGSKAPPLQEGYNG